MTTIQDRIIKSFDKKFYGAILWDKMIGKKPVLARKKIKQFLLTSIKLVEEETRKETIYRIGNDLGKMIKESVKFR